MEQWLPIVQGLGIPGAMLLFLCYAAWKTGQWVGPSVIMPVVNKHIELVDNVQKSFMESVQSIKAEMTRMADAQVKMAQSHISLANRISDAQVKVAESNISLANKVSDKVDGTH